MSDKKKIEEELLQKQNESAVQSDLSILRDTLLEELLNTQPFEFDLDADALYRQYRDSYRRQGEDAAADAFGKAATLTGGYANSYAQTVAEQTYDNYMLALQDKGLEIYNNAYDRYLQENERKADLYDKVSKRENEEYSRLQDAEKQDYEREKYTEQRDYERAQAAEKQAYEREKYAEQRDYERAQTAKEQAYEREQTAEKAAYEQQQDILSFAYKMAQLGDFSYLQAAGIDIAALQAAAKEKEDAPEKISVTIQNAAEETYYYYGYSSLVRYLNRQIAYGQLTEKGKDQIITALTGRG